MVPIQIIVIVALIAQALGWAMVAGLAVILIMLPLMACVFAKLVSSASCAQLRERHRSHTQPWGLSCEARSDDI